MTCNLNRTPNRRRFLQACAAAPLATGVSEKMVTAGERGGGLPKIDCDFPGGNIIVDRIEFADGRVEVFLHQDPRDTAGFWFYWYFRVRPGTTKTMTFHFTKGNVMASRGPAVSLDGGNNWHWLGAEAVTGTSFTFEFPADAREARFCLAVPYLEANLKQLLRRHKGNPNLIEETHCTTLRGRRTERLRFGRLDGSPKHRVLLTCRHHCCEMMAGWALDGLIDAALSDSDDGRWAVQNVEFLAIPFMDKDGVEDGDQGKNRKPHDHNRDYLGESLYPAVKTLRQFVPEWSRGKLRIALDLHCPYIRGGGDGPSSNERVFIVGNPSEEIWARQQEFSVLLNRVQTGPLAHHPRNNIPWGQAWSTLAEPRSCGRWAAELPGMQLATTVEIPYANVAGQAVTADSARLLGHDLLKAIRAFLEA